MKVTIFGTGYVGLVTGTCLAEMGNHVLCVDVDADKIARLERGEIPIFEPGLESLVKRNYEAGRLAFSTDAKAAVAHGDTIFIAVGTPPDEDGKPALTFFREIEHYPDCSLVEATLATGRTHQIRVHAVHAGYPLAGDPKYGEREANKRFAKLGLKRLFLHAARFEFELNGKTHSFSAPLARDLADVLDRLPT